jgi:hypothetical protein
MRQVSALSTPATLLLTTRCSRSPPHPRGQQQLRDTFRVPRRDADVCLLSPVLRCFLRSPPLSPLTSSASFILTPFSFPPLACRDTVWGPSWDRRLCRRAAAQVDRVWRQWERGAETWGRARGEPRAEGERQGLALAQCPTGLNPTHLDSYTLNFYTVSHRL